MTIKTLPYLPSSAMQMCSAHVLHVVVADPVETPWDADCTSSRAINELLTSALWCLQISREVSPTLHTVGLKLRYEGNFLPSDL